MRWKNLPSNRSCAAPTVRATKQEPWWRASKAHYPLALNTWPYLTPTLSPHSKYPCLISNRETVEAALWARPCLHIGKV
eukprot:1161503-Pelagomonas_calceolata.AAC.11